VIKQRVVLFLSDNYCTDVMERECGSVGRFSGLNVPRVGKKLS